jgi:NAD(P)-dependent dehydrogenase (short-subunit alcohol dehydrogenase family)
MKLKDKVAIVTGGSIGIGAAIARKFGAEGATVAVNYLRSEDEAKQVAIDIEQNGGKAKIYKADISKLPEIERLANSVITDFGQVDILVNNAGVFRTVSVMETTEEIWDEQLNLNLKSCFFFVKALVPHWRERGGGKVINISSIAGVGAFPQCPAYCASKGGVVNLTRALAVELGKEKININAIAPGNVATPLNAHVRKDPEWVAMMERLTPTGIAYLDPDDLTGAAVFLASSDSDMVHGQNIIVDAGWTNW